MISIASFMSTASTSNPYLNSNVMFNKNSSNKQMKPYNLNMNDLDNDTNENSSTQGESSNLDEDMDNLDSYLKLRTSQANFNSISNNFGNQIQQVTTDFQSDFLKIFDKNEKEKSDDVLVAALPVDNTTNPFLEPTEQTTNPFMENTLNATQENELNPFLSPSLTNSLEEEEEVDATNPFFNDVSIVKENENEAPLPPHAMKNKTLPIIGKTTTCRNSSSLNLSSTSKDLLDWCRTVVNVCRNSKTTPVFQNVSVDDFSDSWKNGLAFCAIIYHFRPILM